MHSRRIWQSEIVRQALELIELATIEGRAVLPECRNDISHIMRSLNR